jgi:DNA-directed RNA polymerase subunit RPC12/RpoP
MSHPKPARCPDCGGNLYLEPDLVEAMADLVCLQCSRRFRRGRGPGYRAASRRVPGDRPAVGSPRDSAREAQ